MIVNFPAFCSSQGIPFLEEGHHHCHQGWIQIHCPFCAGGEGWHLGYSLEGGNFNCWRCGSHSFLEVMERLLMTTDRKRIFSLLRPFRTTSVDVHTPTVFTPRRRTCPAPPGLMDKMLPPHCRYLRRRGFNPDHITKTWGLLCTGPYGGTLWSWRLVIPVKDQQGQICAYQGRAIRDTVQPRYRLTPDEDLPVDPKTLLYGIHAVPGDAVVIVEGAPSVWRLGAGAVATLGTSWHAEQANILRQYSTRFVLFDPEPTAQSRARKLAAWLGAFRGRTELLESRRTCDPGDYSDRYARRLMASLGFSPSHRPPGMR